MSLQVRVLAAVLGGLLLPTCSGAKHVTSSPSQTGEPVAPPKEEDTNPLNQAPASRTARGVLETPWPTRLPCDRLGTLRLTRGLQDVRWESVDGMTAVDYPAVALAGKGAELDERFPADRLTRLRPSRGTNLTLSLLCSVPEGTSVEWDWYQNEEPSVRATYGGATKPSNPRTTRWTAPAPKGSLMTASIAHAGKDGEHAAAAKAMARDFALDLRALVQRVCGVGPCSERVTRLGEAVGRFAAARSSEYRSEEPSPGADSSADCRPVWSIRAAGVTARITCEDDHVNRGRPGQCDAEFLVPGVTAARFFGTLDDVDIWDEAIWPLPTNNSGAVANGAVGIDRTRFALIQGTALALKPTAPPHQPAP